MAIKGFYVLGSGGELVYYEFSFPPEIKEAVHVWPIDVTDRTDFWQVAIEAQALGAAPERIQELVNKWRLTDEDGKIFADNLGITLSYLSDPVVLQELKFSAPTWLAYHDSGKEGQGATVLEALADLYKKLYGGRHA